MKEIFLKYIKYSLCFFLNQANSHSPFYFTYMTNPSKTHRKITYCSWFPWEDVYGQAVTTYHQRNSTALAGRKSGDS